jgi:isoleucyl-tRNA synthetase
MVELNKKIKWLPAEIGEGRFGKWLEGARDWNVSRSRYWGTPLPIWRNEKGDHIEVLGSIEDLKKKINNRGNKYVVMRHGESVSNVLGIINDNNEIKKCPLTEKGIKEVKASAEVLKKTIQEKGLKVGHIYASPLIRTQETAHLTADVLGFSKDDIITDSRLREINCGILSGQPISEYQNYFTDPEDKMNKPIPNGESNADVKKRMAEFFYDIDSKHENELIVVVTHGLPLHFVKEISEGRTVRDLLRMGWKDMPEHTGSHHWIDFVALPHNEEFEFDLHRPYIDDVTWKNDKGELMKRVPEVFDVWYDSGSMPYAQNHYPFENKEAFEKKGSALFPADFIAEGLDQTRGWFYSLMNLSTAIFDVAPFKNVVVNGLILAEDGRKMSKSLNNFPPLISTVEKYGADALRFYNASSPAVRAEEVKFSEKNLDEVNKKVFMRLANVVTFYESYAENRVSKSFTKPKSPKHILDKWILSRLNQTGKEVTEYLDGYQMDKAARSIADFIDDMSTWYLRRSRDRFKSVDDKDKQCALDTTAYVLYTIAHILAPFAPFFAEDLYLKLAGDKELESVHLGNWPKFDKVDQAVIDNTKEVRAVVEKALAMRSKAGIKVRQPLGSLTLNETVHGLFTENDYAEILKDEINVKEIILKDLSAETAEGGEGMILDTVLTDDLKNEGRVRELTRGVQELRKQSGLSVHDEIILHVSSSDVFVEVLKSYSAEIMPIINAKEIQIGELHLVDSFIASEQNILGTESLDLDGTHARIVLLRAN